MNFYEHVYYCLSIIFLILLIENTTAIVNKNLVVADRGAYSSTPFAVGLVLFVKVNNTSGYVDYDIELKPNECCLELGSEDDCDSMEILGESIENVPKGTVKTLNLVAPLVDTLERKGFCTVYLNSKPKVRQRKASRDLLKIPFDTRLSTIEQSKLVGNITICRNIDEDPLNNCKPVDCETFYNGLKPRFDTKSKRCVSIPRCKSHGKAELPDTIYDPNKNKCIFGESITTDDMKLIKDLTSNVKERKTKDIIILQNVRKGSKLDRNDFDMNLNNTKDYLLKCGPSKLESLKKKGFKYLFAKYIISNKCTLLVLIVVVIVQCCLICTLFFCLTKTCSNCNKKQFRHIFTNYCQDASVTTPLIHTSNIDTETTDYQNFSEMSNIDKKIKCYKACQKERNNNIVSMSDDIILSKCLTRRDWNSSSTKCEALPVNTHSVRNIVEEAKTETKEVEKRPSIINDANKKPNSVTVNFENENVHNLKTPSNVKEEICTVKRFDDMEKVSKNSDHQNMSEQEIMCHSYNYSDADTNKKGLKQYCRKLGFFKSEKKNTGPVSMSTEKGAQAIFPDDSLDEFLYQSHIIYKDDQHLCKSSSWNHSDNVKESSIYSGLSSNSSKKNVHQNELSLIQKRSRLLSSGHNSSSVPDASNYDNNLKLLHMSTASVHSSQNNSSDFSKMFSKCKSCCRHHTRRTM